MAVKSVKVTGNVYATPTGLKAGSRGKVQPPAAFLRVLPKSERRKLRKELHANGFVRFAATPVDSANN